MWNFIQNQIFGMKWLNVLLTSLLKKTGLDASSKIGGSILFFVYDVIKISILLAVLIFFISYIQTFFPPERSRKILGRFHGLVANTIAALLGTVTPFCSCSSIPIFMGFTTAGLPLGVTFSFLISSPMVDLGSLVLLTSIFGWKIALLYVALGLVIAITGGGIIERLKMENQVADFIKAAKEKAEKNAYIIEEKSKISGTANIQLKPVAQNSQVKFSPVIKQSTANTQNENSSCCCCKPKTACTAQDLENGRMPAKERAKSAWDSVISTYKKVALYILLGVGIGALIHNWIPENWITTALGSRNPFGVLIATVLGVPMYADIFGVIPIAESLLAKGALLGVVLSFMMAVTTLSLPSMVMLSKAIKPKLLGIFTGICAAGIVITGYVFNAIQPLLLN